MWQKRRKNCALYSAPHFPAPTLSGGFRHQCGKTKGLAVPYVTNRAIQNRLDDTVGIDGWYNDFRPWKNGSASCVEFLSFPYSLNNA